MRRGYPGRSPTPSPPTAPTRSSPSASGQWRRYTAVIPLASPTTRAVNRCGEGNRGVSAAESDSVSIQTDPYRAG